MEYNF